MKRLSVGLIGLCILLFFLPWISVSCQNMEVGKASGFNLAFGKKINDQSIHDTKITFLLIITVIALISISIIKDIKPIRIINALLGIIGFLLLLIFKVNLDSQVMKEGQGLIKVSYLFGYWLIFITYPMIAFLNLLKESKFKFNIPKLQGIKSATAVYCPKCGEKLSSNDVFCPRCGNKIKEV